MNETHFMLKFNNKSCSSRGPVAITYLAYCNYYRLFLLIRLLKTVLGKIELLGGYIRMSLNINIDTAIVYGNHIEQSARVKTFNTH